MQSFVIVTKAIFLQSADVAGCEKKTLDKRKTICKQ